MHPFSISATASTGFKGILNSLATSGSAYNVQRLPSAPVSYIPTSGLTVSHFSLSYNKPTLICFPNLSFLWGSDHYMNEPVRARRLLFWISYTNVVKAFCGKYFSMNFLLFVSIFHNRRRCNIKTVFYSCFKMKPFLKHFLENIFGNNT